MGSQGLCYAFSRDYVGYGRSVRAIRRHLEMIYKARRRKERREGALACTVCNKQYQAREDQILICELCGAGYHQLCLTPPLVTIPDDEWLCPKCKDCNEVADQEEL